MRKQDWLGVGALVVVVGALVVVARVVEEPLAGEVVVVVVVTTTCALDVVVVFAVIVLPHTVVIGGHEVTVTVSVAVRVTSGRLGFLMLLAMLLATLLGLLLLLLARWADERAAKATMAKTLRIFVEEQEGFVWFCKE